MFPGFVAGAVLQAFDSSSPDIRFVVTALFGMRGVPVVAGQVQGLPPFALNARYESLAFNLPKYFIFPSGELFWEEHMNLMAGDSILRELVRTRTRAFALKSKGCGPVSCPR